MGTMMVVLYVIYVCMRQPFPAPVACCRFDWISLHIAYMKLFTLREIPPARAKIVDSRSRVVGRRSWYEPICHLSSRISTKEGEL